MSASLAKILLDAALGYTESSPQWRVIPVHPTEKRPLLKTGTDHAVNSSTDPEVIARWILRDYPGCRLGVPTGWPSGIIVIDVDAKHDGEALLAELAAALGALPRIRVVRTKSGGLHLYFARPVVPFRIPSGQGIDSALGRLLGRPGVDVRADGGFVVVPPSPGYTWIADDDEPLPALPLVWLAAICDVGRRPQPRSKGRAYTINGMPAWAAEIVDDTSSIQSGGHPGGSPHSSPLSEVKRRLSLGACRLARGLQDGAVVRRVPCQTPTHLASGCCRAPGPERGLFES